MADEEQIYTVEQFVRGIVPSASLSEDALHGIALQVGVELEQEANTLTERERDLCMAYLYLRLATNPSSSARVTDRDADWEHSEGSEQWSGTHFWLFLSLARKLLEKWGEDTSLIDEVTPQWGFVGRNMKNPRTRR